MAGKSHLIGIAGPSGAGKSYLACHLAECLQTPVLSLDHYYRNLSHLSPPERAMTNFDEPAAIEHELLIAQIAELSEGRVVEIPTYDFSLHTRTRESHTFEPAQFVIVEGLFTLYWAELRRLLGTRVYVETPDHVCLQRRQERDVRERGRTPESVIEQFRTTVAPMAERYVRPTREHAHVVVFGDSPIDEEVARVLAHIEREFPASGIMDSAGYRRRTLPSPTTSR